MQLASRIYDADSISAVQELYHSSGWTDGLPIVPPTPEAVEACLEWAMMPPDQLIGIEPVRGLAITAEKLAINAVMAGCLPMHFPVVVTAWMAMMQDEFLMHGATASTGGCAVLVVLNGPIRLELGANGTFNALGNSDRATAVIGRAVRLCLINLMDVRPMTAVARSLLPNALKVPLAPSSRRIGPFRTTSTAQPPVLAVAPCIRNSSCIIAIQAVTTTGKCIGRQPAMTALIASFSAVIARPRTGSMPIS